MTRTLVLLVLGLCLMVGCDDPEEATPPSSEVTPSPPETDPTATDEPIATTAGAPVIEGDDPHAQPEAEELRRRAREDARVVAQARAHTRADEHAEALALLEPLIERTPHGPRLRCEAGYIALRANRLARARELLTEGLQQHGPPRRVRDSMRVPLAMCLYNRGLSHEREGRRDQAAADFSASLALRPNAIVRRHLEEIGEVQPVASPPPAEDSGFPRRSAGADVATAQRRIADAVCATANHDLEIGRERVSRMTGCRTAHEELAVSGDAEGPRVELLTYTPIGVRIEGGAAPRERAGRIGDGKGRDGSGTRG